MTLTSNYVILKKVQCIFKTLGIISEADSKLKPGTRANVVNLTRLIEQYENGIGITHSTAMALLQVLVTFKRSQCMIKKM